MPTYDFRCDCGWDGELRCSIAARDEQVCPECDGLDEDGAPVSFHRSRVYVVQPIGALWDKKIDFSQQTGQVFATNQEFRDFQRTSGTQVLSKDDKILRDGRDRRLNRLHEKARRAGWRDNDHRKQWAQERKKKLDKAGVTSARE